ncbi:MAG: universal stress protein [Acidobacteria bacterium]|nr:universal stress protein [Acidobacteriota bacterium]NIM60152.1 universal stress protein [Acidobacteriota bacterium]NIO57821.1 universal stress protein [Acidobacteriota bacterium]NIQ28830.1 universal stress protein [Acidobacteriota bacterium]NIQ83288.1 universal stress protein [Acidobacteriota bacterium]
MKEIKRILITTDFSETSRTAFPLVREMADKFGAGIVLLHVLDAHLPPLVFEPSGVSAGEFEQQRVERAKSRAEAFATHLGEMIETAVTCGIPHVEIVKFAEDNGIDLVVMATHGRGFFSHAILGSTTERVVRRSPCPVLTVRDDSLED